MAIVNFSQISNDDPVLLCEEDNNNKIFAPNPDFREFGIDNDVQEVLFSNLTQLTRDYLCTPLTQFILLSKYLKEHFRKSLSVQWARDNKFDEAFLKSSFILSLEKFVDSYIIWLNEMSDNDRAFKPFKTSVTGRDLYSIVDGIKPASIKSLWAFNKSGYDLFDAALNEEHSSLSKNFTLPQKFTELFYIVTKILVEKKYKF